MGIVPEYLQNYIDYEAYGRDIRFSDGGEYTDFGYVRDSGSQFVEVYNGDREDIPEEYRVMNFETELTDEKRIEWAKDLAIDLDEFFRQQDPVYAAENPDEVAGKQALQDNWSRTKDARSICSIEIKCCESQLNRVFFILCAIYFLLVFPFINC